MVLHAPAFLSSSFGTFSGAANTAPVFFRAASMEKGGRGPHVKLMQAKSVIRES